MSENIHQRRILSVRLIASKNQVTIGYQKWNEVSHSWDRLTIDSQETPAPEFKESVAALSECVCSIASFPPEWAKEITVTGFARKLDSDENAAVTIKAYRSLHDNNRPLIINTPLVEIVPNSETGQLPIHLERLGKLIDEAVTCSIEFLDGKRGQISLPFGEGETDGEGKGTIVDIEPAADAGKTGGKPKKPDRTAKGKGKEAREVGNDLSANPYSHKDFPDAHASWILGWQERDELIKREAKADEAGD